MGGAALPHHPPGGGAIRYLSGPTSTAALRAAVEVRDDLGVMVTPRGRRTRNVIDRYPFWAADNGCYADPAGFRPYGYLAMLEDLAPAQDRCLFATAPDVVGDAEATWEQSRDFLPKIRSLGYKAALVAQDGIDRQIVEWDAFDVLFVGGTTAFKLSEHAYCLVAEAKARGKWAHMGRCNSFIRLRAAHAAGYDSADGTQLAFGPDVRLAQLVRWLDTLRASPSLLTAAEVRA